MAITAGAAGWVAYQLIWIHQRHKFLDVADVVSEMPGPESSDRSAIWPLNWFGEKAPILIFAPAAKMNRALELFPEVTVRRMPDAG
jgi:hypothetical protein